ncbi:MAG TPA: zf-HC2 domain-containing protein [candidate division Zixibacteria bacterium]|nr:zf-HC2 domain-containing protein [candidate division Zixibacteria bacterium]
MMPFGKSPKGRSCKQLAEDLVLYYYGELEAGDRPRVEAHVERCVSCRGFLDDLRRLLPAMAKSDPLPESFWDDYYREMVAKLSAYQERRSWWKEFLAPMRSWAIPAFGTAMAVVLGLGLTLTSLKWNKARQPEPIPQEILSDANKLEFFKSMDLVEAWIQLEQQDGSRLESGQSRNL